ncbi:MAG: phosphatidate cytidylyltransferase [Paraglaciecola sp.]
MILGIVGFVGDVIISAVKRDLAIKDTSDLIPGHGGLMDRLDSLVLTAPCFYYMLQYFTNNQLVAFKDIPIILS